MSRIDRPAGEGERVSIKTNRAQAQNAADFHERSRLHGAAASPFAGIPISIKDLFDVAGEVTTAGSVALRAAAPAHEDAAAVACLKSVGLCHSAGAAARIPGGSSSGAAVPMTDGMTYAVLGTDTGDRAASRLPHCADLSASGRPPQI